MPNKIHFRLLSPRAATARLQYINFLTTRLRSAASLLTDAVD